MKTLRLLALTLGVPVFAHAQASWIYDVHPTKTAYLRGGAFADMNFNGESTLLAERGSNLDDTTVLLASFVVPNVSSVGRILEGGGGLYFKVQGVSAVWSAQYPFTNTGYDVDWDPTTVTWNNFSGVGTDGAFAPQAGWTGQRNPAYIDNPGPPPLYNEQKMEPGGTLFRDDFFDDWGQDMRGHEGQEVTFMMFFQGVEPGSANLYRSGVNAPLLRVTAVPEPASMAALAIGGVALLRRRKR